MTRGRARVHLAAPSELHPDSGRALCGWLMVDVATEHELVTCKACLARVAEKRSGPKSSRPKSRVNKSDVTKEILEAIGSVLAPTACAPPVLTAQIWVASCRGAEHRRCGECELCVWEREAQMWNAVSPWNRVQRPERLETAPRWPSLNAALVALIEWERHDRSAPSALGGILERIRRGAVSDGGKLRSDDPLMHRAGELVRVRQAVDLAYPEGAHALPAGKLKGILMLRTPGMSPEMPTYEKLSEQYRVSVGELQALVRNGRRIISEELASRGLIPAPMARRRSVRVPNVSMMRIDDEPPPPPDDDDEEGSGQHDA